MMKFFWRMMYFVLVGLIFSMGGISAAMAQSEAPQVTLSFNKESVNVGEEVTASYEVVGGSGNYRNFHFDISAISSGEQDYALSHTIAYADFETRSGKLTAVPKFGHTVMASLSFEDENGQNFYYESEKISVLGDTTVFPTATITFDKYNVNVGEEVTASYEVVGGSGNYRNFHFDISAISSGEQDYALSHTIAYADFETRSGKLTAVPKFGHTVMASLGFEDENGQNFYYESEKLPISGTTGTVTDYEVIEGGGNPVYTGSGALTFRINADFEKFRTLLVDDRPVPESSYTAWAGSTYVSLKESYLATLSEGTHTLSALFSDGYAETTFTIGIPAAATPPRTGDAAMPWLWLTVCLLAGAGFFWSLRRTKQYP
ncbi:MAG: hypothetical protein ACLUO8_13910 [Christensenellales bacterium]